MEGKDVDDQDLRAAVARMADLVARLADAKATACTHEVDDSDGLLAGWDLQSEDEGTPVSSPGADSDVSSPYNAMLLVGEADDSDLDSPPRSSTSQSDRGTGESESSSGNTSTTDDENSDDSNARAKHSLTCESSSECNAELD